MQTKIRTGRFGELIPVRGFSRWQAKRPIGDRTAWRSHDGLIVVSGCETAHLPGTDQVPGPQWLVSVSRSPERALAADVARAVEAFAMPAFDEDNHHPGIARHLWCPIDDQYRHACECKIEETLVADGDYQWSNDDNQCRGCEWTTLSGNPCPIHGAK